jgi:hypothetical protein
LNSVANARSKGRGRAEEEYYGCGGGLNHVV